MVSHTRVDSQKSYAQLLEFKEFVGFEERDAETLKGLDPVLVPELARITNAFYTALLKEPETRSFVEGRIDALKRTHGAWFNELVPATLSDLLGAAGVEAHRSFARRLELDRAVIQLAYDEDRKRTLIENVVRIAR